ncbi:tRNA uridine-5-carboxymethylaminomethyl(34) synthesis GTPase MnmE [Betaproteobacteria bacterium SCN1]|nr:tRNA uridine-5-carboxymethylaminomethyl(34) synthesis GTPase MnmE [Betaproteobacteria bacterium SCN1]MBN8760034.1 tRNA uridine-5-carboxymethylaminomethyl(34) synthesis GTPase MnmE [Thiobacillus sp.]ODU90838.1 MAG: tRNA uridine-5-carboxymethylaminomethyl(34) synthesis GTPase MnmE [Thiobacillus sp. SCN 65-179]OJW35738.1 MAG: tRNA uridine-5-carboxymethylaminomethyl(34) synthesis GTPase MnmE [Thiobacillus sp. 65-69]
MAQPQPKKPELIAAVATAPGRGGVGVIRVSGAETDVVPLAVALLGRLPDARRAIYTAFRDADGSALDQGIALHFAAPHSFTGETVLELQGHGGPAVLDLILRRCLALGARLAAPGEFSRRAFLNGKLDLAQAEAVADLIDAASAEAARSAVRSLSGVFSARVHELVEGLIRLRTLVEATLDFPDEEIDFLKQADAQGQLDTLDAALAEIRVQAKQGALLREGFTVVLVGQPNVGKSSLLNRLAGYEAAIVTDVAGTTRDTVREAIQIHGVPLHVVDTAGLRDTEDAVERIGIARTWAAVEKADVVLLLVDAAHGVGEREAAILARLPGVRRLTVHNKIDASGEPPRVDGDELWLSAKTGEGLDGLRDALLEAAGWQAAGEGVFTARARHLDALGRAAAHLDAARGAMVRLELFAEELRLAQMALSEITGEFTADDLLGKIFGSFCIGK